MTSINARVIALSGGVGGAKLALGLYRALGHGCLTVVANTGDDFRHFGLHVSPDIDTLLYAFAGLSDPVRGWGRRDESWNFMEALGAIGSETWFALGDRDLALHAERSRLLSGGASMVEVVRTLADRLDIRATVLPMADRHLPTIVETDDGDLAFQHYFVREQCRPVVTGFRHEGIRDAQPPIGLGAALGAQDLSLIVICPSNPFISIDPILKVPGIADALVETHVPVIAVSPIIGGRAIKGPTAKMLAELGYETSTVAIARHYLELGEGLIDGFVIDAEDAACAAEIRDLGLRVLVTRTLMNDDDDKRALAEAVLEFGRILIKETKNGR